MKNYNLALFKLTVEFNKLSGDVDRKLWIATHIEKLEKELVKDFNNTLTVINFIEKKLEAKI